MVKELEAKVIELLGDSYKLSFDDGNSLELEFWSPAGEDMPITLSGDNLRELVKDAEKQWEDFDADDHAAQIYHAKHYGSDEMKRFYAGAPDSLEDLVEDAKAIKATYKDIFDRLDKASKSEPKDVVYK